MLTRLRVQYHICGRSIMLRGNRNADLSWHLVDEINDTKDKHLVSVHVKLTYPDKPESCSQQYQLKNESSEQKE